VGEDKNQPWEEVKESNGTHRSLDRPWNAYDSTVLVIWGRGRGGGGARPTSANSIGAGGGAEDTKQ
jgi:hypothetical protein